VRLRVAVPVSVLSVLWPGGSPGTGAPECLLERGQEVALPERLLQGRKCRAYVAGVKPIAIDHKDRHHVIDVLRTGGKHFHDHDVFGGRDRNQFAFDCGHHGPREGPSRRPKSTSSQRPTSAYRAAIEPEDFPQLIR